MNSKANHSWCIVLALLSVNFHRSLGSSESTVTHVVEIWKSTAGEDMPFLVHDQGGSLQSPTRGSTGNIRENCFPRMLESAALVSFGPGKV